MLKITHGAVVGEGVRKFGRCMGHLMRVDALWQHISLLNTCTTPAGPPISNKQYLQLSAYLYVLCC